MYVCIGSRPHRSVANGTLSFKANSVPVPEILATLGIIRDIFFFLSSIIRDISLHLRDARSIVRAQHLDMLQSLLKLPSG